MCGGVVLGAESARSPAEPGLSAATAASAPAGAVSVGRSVAPGGRVARARVIPWGIAATFTVRGASVSAGDDDGAPGPASSGLGTTASDTCRTIRASSRSISAATASRPDRLPVRRSGAPKRTAAEAARSWAPRSSSDAVTDDIGALIEFTAHRDCAGGRARVRVRYDGDELRRNSRDRAEVGRARPGLLRWPRTRSQKQDADRDDGRCAVRAHSRPGESRHGAPLWSRPPDGTVVTAAPDVLSRVPQRRTGWLTPGARPARRWRSTRCRRA